MLGNTACPPQDGGKATTGSRGLWTVTGKYRIPRFVLKMLPHTVNIDVPQIPMCVAHQHPDVDVEVLVSLSYLSYLYLLHPTYTPVL